MRWVGVAGSRFCRHRGTADGSCELLNIFSKFYNSLLTKNFCEDKKSIIV